MATRRTTDGPEGAAAGEGTASSAAEPGAADELKSLRQQVAQLTAENKQLRAQVANLLAKQLPGASQPDQD